MGFLPVRAHLREHPERIHGFNHRDFKTNGARLIAMTFQFLPLREEDLDMLHQWLLRPHVAEWWGPAESIDELREICNERWWVRKVSAAMLPPARACA